MRQGWTSTGLVGLVLAIFACCPARAEAQRNPVFSGKVVSVLSGDTIQMSVDGKRITVRLWGIFAPVEGQPFSEASRNHVRSLALNKVAGVEHYGTDFEGRVLGEVFVDTTASTQIELNRAVLAKGLAWQLPHIANPEFRHLWESLRDAEASARKAQIGVWKRKRSKDGRTR
ncbi:MAG: thermonuclease family protein [Fimbriimonas sp.]